MAMNNNSNYGYPQPTSSFSSSLSAPFSSTPLRSQRPRFAYSGPPSYPRPRSSASKPNPDSFAEGNYENVGTVLERSNFGISDNFGNRSDFGQSNTFGDSMMNNYGGSDYRMESSYLANSQYSNRYPSNSDPYQNSFPSDNLYQDNSSQLPHTSSVYYSCMDTMNESPKRSLLPLTGQTPNYSPVITSTSPIKIPYKSQKSTNSGTDFMPRFQNKKGQFKSKNFSVDRTQPFLPWKKKADSRKEMAPKSEYKCATCNIEFTSSIPYDMHLRGAKHAKKLKTREALQSVQSQVSQSKAIATVGTQFRCDLCCIVANSFLQLQTHLEGVKHKAKVVQQQTLGEKSEATEQAAKSAFNGKSNGASVRTLPADFEDSNPAKRARFSCEVCSLAVNSDMQLQQHLISKKHQAKLSGKPYPPRKFKPKAESESKATDQAEGTAEVNYGENTGTGKFSNETPKTVVGVKTLSSSFVAGETLK